MDDRIRRILIWMLIVFLFLIGCVLALLISPIMLFLPVLLTGILLLLIRLLVPNLWETMMPKKERIETKKKPEKGFTANMVLEKADGHGKPVRIDKQEFRIGRSSDNDYSLGEDGTVTRHHCTIKWDEKSHLYFLEDLDSTHGTFINQERLIPHEPKLLTEGSMIRISSQSFFFRKAKN